MVGGCTVWRARIPRCRIPSRKPGPSWWRLRNAGAVLSLQCIVAYTVDSSFGIPPITGCRRFLRWISYSGCHCVGHGIGRRLVKVFLPPDECASVPRTRRTQCRPNSNVVRKTLSRSVSMRQIASSADVEKTGLFSLLAGVDVRSMRVPFTERSGIASAARL